MTDTALLTLTEDDLDALVSSAILKAESLDDKGSPFAAEAWREVMFYEERLAAMTAADEIDGGVARAGAVSAALAAGDRSAANCLAARYLADDLLPGERRVVIRQMLETDDQHQLIVEAPSPPKFQHKNAS